jgi:hypothetical protein
MQRIILVDGPNIMRDMMNGAIRKDDAIEVVNNFALLSDFQSFLSDGGTLNTDWIIILHTGDEALRLTERLVEGELGYAVMNVASDGSKVVLYDSIKKLLREITLDDLLRVLHAGKEAFNKEIPGVDEEVME